MALCYIEYNQLGQITEEEQIYRSSTLQYQMLDAAGIPPARGKPLAAGIDFFAPADVSIESGRRLVIDTFVRVLFPTMPTRFYGELSEYYFNYFICYSIF